MQKEKHLSNALNIIVINCAHKVKLMHAHYGHFSLSQIMMLCNVDISSVNIFLRLQPFVWKLQHS